MHATQTVLSAVVEGVVDEALLRRICASLNITLGPVYGRYGKQYVLQRLNAYNNSARFRHWIVLLDLDNDASCAPEILPTWLPAPSRLMEIRVAVRELEAWILGDRERIARYLSVPLAQVPASPELLSDPKQVMVGLGRRSNRRSIREDLVPSPGGGQAVGPAYTSRMVEFISDSSRGWRPDVAAANCDSLRRCMQAMTELIAKPY